MHVQQRRARGLRISKELRRLFKLLRGEVGQDFRHVKLAWYVVTEWNKICSLGHTRRTSSSYTFRPRWVRDRDEHHGYGQNDHLQQMTNDKRI